MILTKRNKINIFRCYGADFNYDEVSQEVDFIFEVADAELASRADIHNLFYNNISKTGKKFARHLQKEIKDIYIRENITCYSRFLLEVISQHIAKIWIDNYFADIEKA